MKVPFKNSKFAGKELSECDSGYLNWITETVDTEHPKFGPKNQLLVDECLKILDLRADGIETAPTHAPLSKDAATGLKSTKKWPSNSLLKELKTYIKCIYDAATHAQDVIDIYEGDELKAKQEHSPY